MYKRIVIAADQHFREEDATNIGTFPQEGDEALTSDWLGDLRYSGFATVADGQNAVTVATGRAYIGARQYALTDLRTVSLIDLKPLLAGDKRIVILAAQGIPDRPAAAVVRDATKEVPDGNGSYILQDVTETTPPYVINAAEITPLPGNLSGQPQWPSIPANVVPFCQVTLDTNGIVGTPLMLTDYRAPKTTELQFQILQQAALLDAAFAEIQALRNEVVGLQGQLRNSASTNTIAFMLQDIALLKDKAEVPDLGAPYGFDRLLDDSETATDNVDYAGRIDEGFRLPYANVNRVALSLYNANDPKLMHTDRGLVFPAYDPVVGFAVHSTGDTAPLGGTVTQSLALRKLYRTRCRVRYGPYFVPCTTAAYWRLGAYDPANGIFRRYGEVFPLVADLAWQNPAINWWDPRHWHWRQHLYYGVRLRQVLVDVWKEPYEAWVKVDTTIQGVIKCQSFQQSQERYIPAVRLGIVSWEPGAEVTAALCEIDDDGDPLPERVIQTVTLSAAAFKSYRNGQVDTMTRFVFPEPAFAKRAGYGIIWSTTGQVQVAMASGDRFTGGNWFESTDGQFFVGTITKDSAFAVEYCKFRASTMDVRLANMNLDGGIAGADIVSGTTVPQNTAIQFQPFSNGAWRTIAQVPAIEDSGVPADEDTAFGNGTQATYDFRVFLTGNEWVMPVLDLGQSEMTLFRPGVAGHHVSIPREVPDAVWSKVYLKAQLGNYDAARHTLGAHVDVGTALTTQVNPDGAPVIEYLPAIDRYQATWTFTTDPTDDVFEAHITLATNNAAVPIHLESTFYRLEA
ncbi:hypothetical protein [Aurantimonas sp. VKM B-3413]|uniref:hypothetical protein n=1 Tax=Aurantimonas sp. VKM B-3413 TaxID=2779401 RepID=UPI001E592C98|nr:hypothetical protein [Aurantimonas sp. VKM B-3413]MCB8835935.1 hypothetical protein [Aurantimonas sp. VKM B-3413]